MQQSDIQATNKGAVIIFITLKNSGKQRGENINKTWQYNCKLNYLEDADVREPFATGIA